MKKALYVWNWECGGFNQTWASSKKEALQKAEEIWPGHPVALSTLRRLSSKKQQGNYWNNIPLMD